MILFESPRKFWLGEYLTSQRLLWLRSRKSSYGEPLEVDNIDLIFTGVFYIESSMGFGGLTVETLSGQELEAVQGRVQRQSPEPADTYFALRGDDETGYIGAATMRIERNTLPAWDSNLGQATP